MSRVSNRWNPTPPAGRMGLWWAEYGFPSHQCKSRHIAEATAWRQRRMELNLLCWRPRRSRVLILWIPESSQVYIGAYRLAALQVLLSPLCNCCASPLWIEVAWSLRAAERKGTEALVLKEFGETSPQDCSSYDEETLRWQLSPSALCFLWLLPKVSPCAGIPLSVILFSPRSLLPGQMHTNAFRSSTDKEWTRFPGSNVSGHLVKYSADVRLSMRWSCFRNRFSLDMATGRLISVQVLWRVSLTGRQLTKQVSAAELHDCGTKTWHKLFRILESLSTRRLSSAVVFLFLGCLQLDPFDLFVLHISFTLAVHGLLLLSFTIPIWYLYFSIHPCISALEVGFDPTMWTCSLGSATISSFYLALTHTAPVSWRINSKPWRKGMNEAVL